MRLNKRTPPTPAQRDLILRIMDLYGFELLSYSGRKYFL